MKARNFISQKWALFLLILIITTGAFLRFWGLSSVYQRVDDIPVARSILTIYQGDWRPDPIYFYPIFFNYLVALIMHVLSFVANVLRLKAEPGLYPFNLDETLTIARIVSALLGSMTILIVYSLARRWLSQTQAFLAAFIFSFSFIHIIYCHQIVLDGPMTFFYFLSFYFCFLIFKEGRTRHYLLAGVFAGLAIATKYNGIYIVFSILLAHFGHHFEKRSKLSSFFLSPRIYLAASATVLAFFLGHPYAFLRFRHFVRATLLLARTVNETEWHLQPIIPQTFLEHIKFNKYILGASHIYQAEGLLFSALILAGLIWVILKGKKEHWFLLLSSFFYFLGALGFLGFYRYRDLVPLTPFYSFLALFGFNLIPDFRRKGALIRASTLTIILLILGYRTTAMTYYLWQDDTTQIASRWMKLNLPERSWIGKEWFTPSSPDPDLRFRFSSRPYLFNIDLHPLNKFDYIITSSACSQLFLENQKFYPDWSRPYLELERQHELVKKFFLVPIEYKNPEIKIYSGRAERRRKLSFWLPQVPPLFNPPREFQIIDHSLYEKDINTFWLHGQERIRRIFISETELPLLAVFLHPVEGQGQMEILSGWRRKKINIQNQEPVWVIMKPGRIFPFLKRFYRVDIKGSVGLKKVRVNLVWDNFNLALNFFKLGDYHQARKFFEKALSEEAERVKNVEAYLLLALCCERLGEKDVARKYLKAVAETPEYKRYLNLYEQLSSDGLWLRYLERYAGLDYHLWRLSQGNIIEDKLFKIEKGLIYEGDIFLNRKGIGPVPGEKTVKISSPAFELSPGNYQLEAYFYNPNKITGFIGRMVIEFRGQKIRSLEAPLIIQSTDERSFSMLTVNFKQENLAETVSFSLEITSSDNLIFDYLKYYPDLKSFLEAKYELLSPVFALARDMERP
jgi:tetratricopeptide (TPR) repeat protein